MTRTFALSLISALPMLIAASAASATGIQVKVAGRTQAQVQADVFKAANDVCRKAINTDVLNDFGTQEECVATTVRATLHRLGTLHDRFNIAQAEIASR